MFIPAVGLCGIRLAIFRSQYKPYLENDQDGYQHGQEKQNTPGSGNGHEGDRQEQQCENQGGNLCHSFHKQGFNASNGCLLRRCGYRHR